MNRRKHKLLLLSLAVLACASIAASVRNAASSLPSAAAIASPLAGNAQAAAVRFVALGDTGTGGEGQFAIARQMVSYHDSKRYDTALLLGDNVYPDGDAAELPARFEQPYAELLRRGVRFHAVLGNHDVQRGREAQVNYKLFNMGGRPFYSFTAGDNLVEFFALDSNRMEAEQLRWLEAALANSKARWKLAFFHHPIYSSGRKHGSNKRLRTELEPLFVRYGVAAAFSGHDHIYERIKPQQGVQYFVSGAGGQLRRGNMDRSADFFSAGNDEVNSFMYVEVTRDKLAFWSVDAQGRVLDSGAFGPPAPVARPE
ncbi:MAG TPA: metallophosphoesterase [Pyrinomonadaceae bacterium]